MFCFGLSPRSAVTAPITMVGIDERTSNVEPRNPSEHGSRDAQTETEGSLLQSANCCRYSVRASKRDPAAAPHNVTSAKV